jgi:hypothetical protein
VLKHPLGAQYISPLQALTPSFLADIFMSLLTAVLGDLFRFNVPRRAWAELSAGIQGPPPTTSSFLLMTAIGTSLYVYSGYDDPDGVYPIH